MFNFIPAKLGYTSMNIDSEQIKLKALTQRSPYPNNGCEGDYLRREGFIFNMTFSKPLSPSLLLSTRYKNGQLHECNSNFKTL